MSEQDIINSSLVPTLGDTTNQIIDENLDEMADLEPNELPDLGLNESGLSQILGATSTQVDPPLQQEGPSAPACPPKKSDKRRRRTRKSKLRDCTICRKKVQKIGQHLDKVHRSLSQDHRKFLMSFYSTQYARGPVYQCVHCPLRMTNPRRHRIQFPRHVLLKVHNKKTAQEFPPEIAEVSEANDLGAYSAAALQKFTEMHSGGSKGELPQFKRKFLKALFSKTDHFKNTQHLSALIDEYKDANDYTHNTMTILLNVLKEFIVWLKRHHSSRIKIKHSSILDEIKDYRSRNKKSRKRETTERKEERFETVPDMAQMGKLAEKLENLFVQGVSDDITYLELASTTIIYIMMMNDCRLSMIQNCTSSEYSRKKIGDVLRSREHKTGDVFENFFQKTVEVDHLVQRCRSLYKAETKKPYSSLLLSNKKGTKLTTVAVASTRCIERLIGKQDFSFNPNAIRKCWETHVHNKADAMPEHLRRAFRSNTGHSEQTAVGHYVAPLEDSTIKEMLAVQRRIIRDAVYAADSCNVATSSAIIAPEASESTGNEPEQMDTSEPRIPRADEDDDAYTTDPLYTSNSEVTLGTSDTRTISRVNYAEKSSSEESEDSTATLASKTSRGAGLSTRQTRQMKSKRQTVGTDKYENLKKRLLVFKGPKDPLQPSMKRLIDIIVKTNTRLSKKQMRNVMKPLRLNYEDQEHVLNKVYIKYNKLCNEFGI